MSIIKIYKKQFFAQSQLIENPPSSQKVEKLNKNFCSEYKSLAENRSMEESKLLAFKRRLFN